MKQAPRATRKDSTHWDGEIFLPIKYANICANTTDVLRSVSASPASESRNPIKKSKKESALIIPPREVVFQLDI